MITQAIASLVLITLLIVVILTAFFSLLMTRYRIPFTKRAPYVPTSKDKLRTIISLADPLPEDIIANLGSGDGRLVISLAHTGAIVHGYEIKPF